MGGTKKVKLLRTERLLYNLWNISYQSKVVLKVWNFRIDLCLFTLVSFLCHILLPLWSYNQWLCTFTLVLLISLIQKTILVRNKSHGTHLPYKSFLLIHLTAFSSSSNKILNKHYLLFYSFVDCEERKIN